MAWFLNQWIFCFQDVEMEQDEAMVNKHKRGKFSHIFDPVGYRINTKSKYHEYEPRYRYQNY